MSNEYNYKKRLQIIEKYSFFTGRMEKRKITEKIPVDISLILGNLITVIFDYQIPYKPLKILSL